MLLTTSFTLATMFYLSPVLTLAVVPLVPVFLITRQHFRSRLAANADTVQSDRLTWNRFLEEHISAVGLPVLDPFGPIAAEAIHRSSTETANSLPIVD
jgi:hypothetical protein